MDVLRELGCDRIYSAAHDNYTFEDIIKFLRPGDILAVADLSRLGHNLDRVIDAVDRLHAASVRLHVAGTKIVPNTAIGDSFGGVCSILKQFSASNRHHEFAREHAKLRGRPQALAADTKVRVERMLKDGRMRVAEIAQVLNVSPATIYRHFPHASRTARTYRASRSSTR